MIKLHLFSQQDQSNFSYVDFILHRVKSTFFM